MASNDLAFQAGLLMGGLVAGVTCGFGPLGTGFHRRRIILGGIGFTLCVFAGLAGGFILAFPLAFVLSLGIRLIPKAAPNFSTAESMSYTANNPYARGQQTAFGHEIEKAFAPAVSNSPSA